LHRPDLRATRTLCKVKEMEREAAEMRRADAIHDHGLHPPLDDTT
jgi:hypothetical protein